jgi:hypothetical protein
MTQQARSERVRWCYARRAVGLVSVGVLQRCQTDTETDEQVKSCTVLAACSAVVTELS